MDLNQIVCWINADSGKLAHGTTSSVWGLKVAFLHANLATEMPLVGSGKSLRIYIGADADSGLIHEVVGTPANVNDATHAQARMHRVYADTSYQGVANREDVQDIEVKWHNAI